MIGMSIVLGVLAISIAYMGVIAGIAMYRARTPHPVSCPADGSVALVKTKPGVAALRMFSDGDQQVVGCSHWPERDGCARACEHDLTP